jgi:AcrR family transcriptional regulator
MPRPKSDEKRSAILEAATRIIVTQGLSAPTAGIAKEAGVANGSLFTYFETKTDLFNELYLELKNRDGVRIYEGPSHGCRTS